MASTPTFPAPNTPRISVSTPTLPPLPPSESSSRATSFDASTLSPHLPSPVPSSRKPSNPRTRSALRSFYNLPATTSSNPGTPLTPTFPANPLDNLDLDAAAHTATLLAQHSPAELLALENSLIAEIRGLDGDRKALVYDNYSKLIDATDTIRRMRRSMEPLAPTTRTMEPAVGHIEEVARGLCAPGLARRKEGAVGGDGGKVVRWVLGVEGRVGQLKSKGRNKEAAEVVERCERILEGWEKKGVKEVKAVQEKVGKARESLSAGTGE